MRQKFIKLLKDASNALENAEEHTNNGWELRQLLTIRMMIDEIINDKETK